MKPFKSITDTLFEQLLLSDRARALHQRHTLFATEPIADARGRIIANIGASTLALPITGILCWLEGYPDVIFAVPEKQRFITFLQAVFAQTVEDMRQALREGRTSGSHSFAMEEVLPVEDKGYHRLTVIGYEDVLIYVDDFDQLTAWFHQFVQAACIRAEEKE